MRAFFLSTVVAASIAVAGCGDDGGRLDASGDTGTTDTSPPDAAADAIVDSATDAIVDSAPADTSTAMLEEMEPNDGTTTDEVNDLPVGATMSGTIDAAGDSDIFLVPTMGGRAYLISLTTPGALMGHLTVIDSGRDGDPAGDDYVHLSGTGVAADVELDLLAMGDGHLVAVRDVRSLDGGAGSGGPDHDYTLQVTELDPTSIATPLSLPGTTTGALSHPGAVQVYSFDGTEGTWVTMDLMPAGSMDARLFVVAEATGSWIARNDDRSAGDNTPLIDAPLTASGSMYLVVENIDEGAPSLAYSIESTLP
jgi:hypothetical protein